MNDTAFPKVLIIGECFRASGGPGITLESLFEDWPSDKIADVHGYPDRSDRITNNHYYLSDRDARWLWQSHSSQTSSKHVHNSKVFANSSVINHIENKNDYSLHRRISNQIIPAFCLGRGVISNELGKWLSDFSPEVIYAQPSVTTLSLIKVIHSYLRIPLIIHIMDDWPSQINTNGALLGCYAKSWARKQLKYLLNESTVRLGICEEMALAYQKRYNMEFGHYQHLIEYERWSEPKPDISVIGEPVKILYAGRIGNAVSSSIVSIGAAVDQLREEMNIEFDIVTANLDVAEHYALKKYIWGKGYIPHDQMKDFLKKYDILCIPLDHDDASIRFAKLSMPTKVPEYLACGVPILVFAPEETALAKYARKDRWAEVVDTNSIHLLKSSIRKLATDRIYRKELVNTARDICLTNHSSERQLTYFRKEIFSAM